MAEMSTLLGYEIVDKKARELIANLGGGGGTGDNTSEMFKTIRYDDQLSVASVPFDNYIFGAPVVGMKMYGKTIVDDFTEEETLYNPRTIPNIDLFWVRYNLCSGSIDSYLSNYVYLPSDINANMSGFSISSEQQAQNYLRINSPGYENNKYITDDAGTIWASDEVDFEAGKYYKRTHSATYDGSSDEAWTKVYPDDNDSWLYKINLGGYSACSVAGDTVCDRLPQGIWDTMTTSSNALEHVCCIALGVDLYVNIGYYMTENTVDNLRSVLTQYPITVSYLLSKALVYDISNDTGIQTYRRIRLNKKKDVLGLSGGMLNVITEVSYPITDAGAALAFGARETDRDKYETQLDRLYEHFKLDQYLRPYCTIIFPNYASSAYNMFWIFFTSKHMYEKTSYNPVRIYCRDGGFGIEAQALSGLTGDFDRNDISAVVDIIIANFTSDDIKSITSNGDYSIDTSFYTYYTNYKYASFPSLELDIPFDGTIKFPKITGEEITYGTAGQYIITNGDGTVGFADGAGSGTDVIVPTKVSELENDAGYITADALSDIESRLTALENIDIAEGGAY